MSAAGINYPAAFAQRQGVLRACIQGVDAEPYRSQQTWDACNNSTHTVTISAQIEGTLHTYDQQMDMDEYPAKTLSLHNNPVLAQMSSLCTDSCLGLSTKLHYLQGETFRSVIIRPDDHYDCLFSVVRPTIACNSNEFRNNNGVRLLEFVLSSISSLCHAVISALRTACVMSRLTCATAYRFLILLTPRGAWWPQYLYRLNMCAINACFERHKSVTEICRALRASQFQSIFRRHDYAVFRAQMLQSRRQMVIFVIASHFSFVSLLCVQPDSTPFHTGLMTSGVTPSVGGGRSPTFKYQDLLPYVDSSGKIINPSYGMKFVIHNHHNVVEALYKDRVDHVYGKVPLDKLVTGLIMKDVKAVAKIHNVFVPARIGISNVADLFRGHSCTRCETHTSVFVSHAIKSGSERVRNWYSGINDDRKKEVIKQKPKKKVSTESQKQQRVKRVKENRERAPDFPPLPPSKGLQETVIQNWCKDTSPNMFTEAGCAVCGQLTPACKLSKLSDAECDLDILVRDGAEVTRLERDSRGDPTREVKGPVLDQTCSSICESCKDSLDQGFTPKYALANGLWIGAVPPQLQNLSYAEQLLVSRVRRNKCIVQVSSGMHKMKANVIAFENPMPKIYERLPPPAEDLDEVLAFIYTGPCRPTPEDIERTPLLVRRNKVGEALEWLKLNHVDYLNMDIAYDNLESYPENGPPVVITYRGASTNKSAEAVSAFDNELEDGVDSGPCPFTVNGITGENLSAMGPKALAARAAKHLKEEDGKVLAIGHAEKPESIYDNPQLYPMMFPWLFPYGLGGIGIVDSDDIDMSDSMHKRRLLMYHDKRFQLDPHFPLIAFNHDQIKNSTTGGYLMTEKRNFDEITERLMNVDVGVLDDLSKRLSKGDRVKPVTEEEKACYQLISDLDYVGGRVKGSITSKKYMRNEIWSLISYIGAPSWFITFAPADNNSPICLYYADTKETFCPKVLSQNDRYRLIARNPVAGARFFHFMVQMFIKHVLGVEQDHTGIYGDTSAYYGTVEQQGRLTLHLHLLLWISGSLTPQEIRDKIMDVDSDFQKKMVEYLESLCMGEFLTGPKVEVSEQVENASKSSDYHEPTLTLPVPPPLACGDTCKECSCDKQIRSWWLRFRDTVDDLLLRSNQHVHKFDSKGNNISYCMTSKGECKRRFPRDTFEQTLVDPKTGALNLKKGEAWMNTVTPVLTYLLRSNTDVTSLLSGTAIKAIVAYVSDYITKPGLKTYSIFDIIKSVFDKNSEMIGGTLKRREKARKIITQIVNSLTAKMEIGGPMASLYILGNPDHYTDHKFIPFYWRGYVREVLNAWEGISTNDKISDLDDVLDKVVINKNRGEFVGLSKVNDYVYRPSMYESVSLYDWIRLSNKSAKGRSKKKHVGAAADDPEFDESDDELNLRPVKTEQMFEEKTTVMRDKSNNAPIRDFIEDDIGGIDGNDNSDDEDEDDRDELDVMEELAEDVPKIDHYFKIGHPQSNTHGASMRKEDPFAVPNFLPNVLPRSDRGDREYYCCTMLTLFKPWRSGRDLKSDGDSWDKGFVAHDFTKRQRQILDYFNVRYECLDARDDYSAKKDKGEGDISYQWATSEMIHALDDLHDSELALVGAEFDINEEYDGSEEDVLNILGKRGRTRRNEMLMAERTLRLAGWLDECEGGPPDVGDLAPMEPEHNQTSKAWRAAVLSRKQAILDERNSHLPTNANSVLQNSNPKPDQVEVVDKSYIDHAFKSISDTDDRLVRQSISEYKLNPEQERAFRIIANHSMMEKPEKLKMYLGGMGGTGKSQVIKALMHFFGERKETHRFLVVAPTGAAAALLNGSTYHSVLGITDGEFISAKSLAQIRARLDGVDYIFLDEVSMLSCRDMYKISAQAAKARGVHDEPFGGINFIFAGDFAQLPPVRSGCSLYSGGIGTQIHSGQSVEHQESAIGKALWHQVTTVVILRQNMRQAQQTDEDAQLRTALENMRYKSCTPEDITFLRTRIAGRGPNDPKLAQKRFRNVSIITARNAQRDKINELGSERFATENGQTLESFYSIDKWKNPDDKKMKGGHKAKLIDPVRKSNLLSPRLQRVLWEQPPASSDKHVAGKLNLCVGLPVMLKHNDATECCITKGAEATVVSWQTAKGPEGQMILDTLFVKLKDPPKMVKIDGLPENVVPITRHTTATICGLPNDDDISLSRDQVLVLPNFAMTDYSSQGRTRPNNVVDLNSCRTHQSYYTCLSRSATADGTIIVQGFDPKVITGGASGYLRQEFRELELLDEITRLRYEGVLSKNISGNRRNIIIRQFQTWKGTDYVPRNVHHSIRWNSRDPLNMLDVMIDTSWQIVKKNKYDQTKKSTLISKSNTTGFIAAKGTVSIDPPHGQKRKLEREDAKQISKKLKMSNDNPNESEGPMGFIWDGQNYSCAYDSVLTILLTIWSEDSGKWKRQFKDMNRIMNVLATGCYRAKEDRGTLESARNKIRHLLHQRNPGMLPYGQVGTNVSEMTEQLLRSDNIIASNWLCCVECNDESDLHDDLQTCVIQCIGDNNCTISTCLQRKFKDRRSDKCIQCDGEMNRIMRFDIIPKILVFSVADSSIRVSKKISMLEGDSMKIFNLKGIVYFGDFHYTARVFTKRDVWFHNGMVTGRRCKYEKKLSEFTDVELSTCEGKVLSLVFYAQS